MPAAALNNDDADGASLAISLSARDFSDADSPPGDPYAIAKDDVGQAGPISLSVGLHLALLILLIGNLYFFDVAGLSPALSLPLPLEAELVDGRSLRPDDANVDQATATPTTAQSKERPTLSPRPQSTSAAPETFNSKPTQVPTGEQLAHDHDFRSDTSVPGEAPAPREVAVFTTAPDEHSVELPVRTNDPAEPQRKEMPVSLKPMIVRRIMQGLRNQEHEPEPPSEMSWKFRGQTYTAFIERRPAQSDTDIERVNVEIQSQQQGQSVEMHMQMKRLAFSHFTQLVDKWDDGVQLHDDEVDGRFHINTELFVSSDLEAAPRFLGKVTTAAADYALNAKPGRHRRSDIFRAGFERDTGEIHLPSQFLRFSPAAHPQMQVFPEDTRITFYPDGTYGWSRRPSNVDDGRRAIAGPTYLIAEPRTTLFVRGTVKGLVTVYSPERIVIEDDLTYADDSAKDCLGLVSDRSIEIAPSQVTGPSDLEIHAALYAKQRFEVTDLDARPGHATMFIHGSLATGSLSATEPRYATRITFDPRLENMRPPGFPVTNHYEIEGPDSQPLSAIVQ